MSESIFLCDNVLTIKSAKKMLSSTSTQAVIETTSTSIVVTGTNLEVKKLDLENGEVCLAGKVTNIKLSTAGAAKPSLLKRIFK